jgi:hypothetical protein
MSARRIAWAMGIGSAALSGIYLLVYLYRWEWNRALIAGVLFVASEIGLGVALVLSRLARIERRLDQVTAPPQPDPAVLARIEEAAPPARNHFAWLRPDGSNMNVFVPLLMGAGMIVSGLAWLVERIARATAKPSLERGLALRLAPLALPAGGFLGTAPAPAADPVAALRRAARRASMWRGVVVVLLLAMSWMAVDLFADATQDRPDDHVVGSTLLVVDVRHRNPAITVDPVKVSNAHWAVCERTLPHRMDLVAVTPAGPGRAQLLVEPAIGEHALRRFRGCLADVNFDRILTDVVSVRNVPVVSSKR